MPGRPKKNRRKAEHEEPKRTNSSGALPRTGRQIRCTNCKQVRHNKKSCKNPTVHVTKHKPRNIPSTNLTTIAKEKTKNSPLQGKLKANKLLITSRMKQFQMALGFTYHQTLEIHSSGILVLVYLCK